MLSKFSDKFIQKISIFSSKANYTRSLLFLGMPLSLFSEINWQSEMQKPFNVTIALDSTSIQIDHFLNIQMQLFFPSSYHVDIDHLLKQLTWSANPLAPQINLYNSSVTSSSNENGEVIHLHAIIIPLEEGPLELSFFNVNFIPKKAADPPVRILTPVFKIQVLPRISPLSASSYAPLLPLENQFPLSLTQANRQLLIENPDLLNEEKIKIQNALKDHSFPWLALAILVGAGGIGWTAYLMRDYLPKFKVKPVKLISPLERAENDLNRLKEKHLLEQGKFQEYYAELSIVLLGALESPLGRKTKRMTTSEIDRFLIDKKILSIKQKEELLMLLAFIDQVKFARKKPTSEITEEITLRVHKFIHNLNNKN